MTKFFRIAAYLEGISYILLLFIAVPVKYMLGNPAYVKMLGMPHGIFFIAYVFLAYQLSVDEEWPRKKLVQAFVAALLPFGTFIFDYKIFHHKSKAKENK